MSNQIEIFDIPTPCRRVCETDTAGYCLACYRSREERFNWLNFNNEQKKEVLRLCHQRRLRRRYQILQKQKAQQHDVQREETQLDLF